MDENRDDLKFMDNQGLDHNIIFENISDLIVFHETNGRLLKVNPAVLQLYGLDNEAIKTKSILDLMHPKYKDQFNDQYIKDIKEKGYSKGILVTKSKEGNNCFIEYNNVLVEPIGQKPYIYGIGRNITARIKIRVQRARY
jgi:PAS domain S-box-containing protein